MRTSSAQKKTANFPQTLQTREEIGRQFDINPTTSTLHQQALQIGRVLQSSLDVYTILKKFYTLLQQKVPFKSLHYVNLETNHSLNLGQKCQHQIHYQISLDTLNLGEITLTRHSSFSTKEERTILQTLAMLDYPLNNALKYHEAILLSSTDALTRLGNRAAFAETYNREMCFAKRHKSPLTLLVIDIDYFKKINDTYGHLAGDTILVQLAKRLAEYQRNSDIVFRYGGEEFIVLLRDADIQGGKHVAERIRLSVANLPFDVSNKSVEITVSIGVASYSEGDTGDTLFKRADSALYTAKRFGRNRVST